MYDFDLFKKLKINKIIQIVLVKLGYLSFLLCCSSGFWLKYKDRFESDFWLTFRLICKIMKVSVAIITYVYLRNNNYIGMKMPLGII